MLTLEEIFKSMKKQSPTFPIILKNDSILFEEKDCFFLMYKKTNNGVVHCIKEDGYPVIFKRLNNLLTNCLTTSN